MKVNGILLVGLCVAIAANVTMAATLQTKLVAEGATNGGVSLSDGERTDAVTGRVWDDSTANGNDAQGLGTYNTARFNTDGTNFNGSDYFDLDGNNWYLLGAASVSSWGFTTVMVANIADHDDDRVIMSLGDSTSGLSYTYLQFAADGKNLTVGYRDGYTFRDSSTAGMNFSGADHIFTVVYRAADDIEVFVDGESVLTYTGTAGSINVFDRYGLGGTADNTPGGIEGSGIAFEIAEARVYTGAWGSGEREAMELELMTAYGFAVPARGTVIAIN